MILDSFMFFDEVEILEIRLNELDGLVDRFILAEAPLTHSGRPKPLHFAQNKDRFKDFLNKIIHVVVEDFPPADMSRPGEPWKWERHQREAVMRGIPANAGPGDILIHSDVDEIPRSTAIRTAMPVNRVSGLDMRAYSIFLNCYAGPWTHARIGPLAAFRKLGPYRVRHEGAPIIPDAGWHFSSIGTPERISGKLTAYAHQEPNIQQWNDPAKIRENIAKGIGLWGFGTLDYRKVDDTFPSHLLRNLERFGPLIHPC